jgi:hypothetical protein
VPDRWPARPNRASLAPNPTEENSFFGVPLLLLTVACFVSAWRHAGPARRATLWALGVAAVGFTLLSWGPVAKVAGHRTDVPMPFDLLGGLPVVNAALPSRLALVVAPVIGLLLAYTVDRLRTDPPRHRSTELAWAIGYAVALLPLVPTPLLTDVREPVPAFITSGTWREYVSPGGVLTRCRSPSTSPRTGRTPAYALALPGEFAIPAGFFLGPGGPAGTAGSAGPAYLQRADGRAGRTRLIITDGTIRNVRADLSYWRSRRSSGRPVHRAKYGIDEEAIHEPPPPCSTGTGRRRLALEGPPA